MYNPYEEINNRLISIEGKLSNFTAFNASIPPEIIDRPELRRRLNLTEPSIIRWEKKGRIPSIRIGSSVRYNWISVVAALEKSHS